MLTQKLKNLKLENCSKIGTLIKLHGFKGHFLVNSDFDFQAIEEEAVFIYCEGYLLPLFIIGNETKYPTQQTAIIKFRDLDKKYFNLFIGKDLYFPSEQIEDITEEENQWTKVIGYKFIDTTRGELGEITDFIEIANNPLFQLFINDKEVLIPINSLIDTDIDHTIKTLTAKLPDGLIDIYL